MFDDMTQEELEEYRSKYIPHKFPPPGPRRNELSPTEIAEQKGWERYEEPVVDQNGCVFRTNVYWRHPKYVPMQFGSNKVEEEPDPEGVGEFDIERL